MIQNYIKVAFRQIWRSKGYSLINILGLAVGIACCLIILMYVWDETSFDKFHEKGDRIYRMALDRHYPGRMRSYATIPHSYAAAVKEDISEVEEAVRIFDFQQNALTLRVGEQVFEESRAMWADSNFFKVFSIPLVKGDPNRVLVNPNSVVLTESTARRYFGDADPIGKVLDIPDTENDLVVTGVCTDVPGRSHMIFNMLMSSTSFDFLEQPNFIGFSAHTYLLLHEGANAAAVEGRFPDVVRKYAAGPIQRQFSVSYDEYVKAGNGYHYFLQPLKDIYLNSNLENELRPPGSKTRVYIFTIIAAFILLIAIVNFMNLATARSTERAKEVGIRKTLGSLRSQIAGQFLVEATTLGLLSTIVALALLNFLIPLFNDLSGKGFTIGQLINWRFIPLFLLFALAVGLLAGSYPSLALSRFRPVEVLKGNLLSAKSGVSLRNGLVVFQFTTSVALIISTVVVYNQMQFIRKKELGFNKEQVVSIKSAGFLQAQTEAFKEELLKLPEVKSIGGCSSLPGGQFFGVSFRKEGENETMFGSGIFVDENFIGCLEMELIEGRDFSKAFNDSLSLVLNESAVRELELENPVGRRLITVDVNPQTGEEETVVYTVIGVMRDFHFQSLHQKISPVYFFYSSNPQGANNLITARLREGNLQAALSKIESAWNQFMPDRPFDYSFLDNDLDELYQSEQVAQKIFGLFALLAIFIACLGLLGLAAFITRQRTKEIGIRKVLGASAGNIVSLLSTDFLKLVFIALLIATPLAWYAMSKWLEGFAYRIDLSWWIFALSGLLAIAIAFLTVSWQSVRAALMNPVKALRNE
jgi:putative ABC transport system permease protein